MAQKIIQIRMRHLHFNLKDLFSNPKGFVILTSLLRFKNKSREFREHGEDLCKLCMLSRLLIILVIYYIKTMPPMLDLFSI